MKEFKKVIHLVSSDKKIFPLQHYESLPCNLIRETIDGDEEDEDNNDAGEGKGEETHLQLSMVNVNSDTLQHVVRFLQHYANEPMNGISLKETNAGNKTQSQTQTPHLAGSSFDEIVQQEWYRRFILDLPREMVFSLVNAANYMDIQCLMDLACLKVSFDLMDKNAEEIRVILNLPKLTKEEEARAREEHSWMFEG